MKTIEEQKRKRKSQLTLRYMLSVGLIFLVSLSSLVMLDHILEKQDGYAVVINMSGRQRMLSQQISLLAYEIITEQREDVKVGLLDQIDFSINLIRESHQQLVSQNKENGVGVEPSVELLNIYFHAPFEVDRIFNEYLLAIEALVGNSTSEKNLDELSALSITARGALLDGLDRVVKQFEMESVNYSESLKKSSVAIFLITVVLLFLIILFGFRPMVATVVENEGMLNSILDSIPVLMDIVRKEDGTILYQSKFLLDRLGASGIGKKCFEAYKTDTTSCESCPQRHLGSAPMVEEFTCFDKLGVDNVINITHLPIVFKGEDALLQTFQDVTEQRNTETFLTEAKEEADHVSNLKSNFLANMSHEIRTPMNAILGFSDLIIETKLNIQQRDYLNKIRHSSKSLLQVINKILDFSSVDAGEVVLEKKEFSLEGILEELIHFFGDQALEKNIELVIHQEKDIPVLLVGDALRLQQILANLLSNSVKFTDEGVITVQMKRLPDTARRVNLEFNVRDTGIGIAREKLSTLFTPFSQADSSTTRQYEGTGLGLAISSQLVELLGGNLTVNSEEGVGTVFSFKIGFEMARSQVQRADEKKACSDEKSVMANIRGAHLLLVEDDAINCQVAEAILAKADISVDVVNNGQQALGKIPVAEVKYDAVLMDIQMPVMGGVECVQEIRKREEVSATGFSEFADRLPIIAMTANVLKGDKEHFLQAGMDDYVAKPIDKKELFAVLARWISKNNFFTIRVGEERRQTQEQASWSGENRRKREERRKQSADGNRLESDEYHLPEDLPGIDLKQGLARLEGNSGLYIRLLKEFAVDISSSTEDIAKALETEDQECAVRIVHTVKGMAGSLGATKLASASLAFEMTMRNGGNTRIEFAEFTEALQSTQHSLAFFRNDQEEEELIGEIDHSVNEEKVAKLVLELDNLLLEKNFEAGSKWDELKPLLSGADKGVLIKIDNLIARFDFEASRKLLRKV